MGMKATLCRAAAVAAVALLALRWKARRSEELERQAACRAGLRTPQPPPSSAEGPEAAVKVDPELRVHVYNLRFFDSSAAVLQFPSCKADQWAADYHLIEKLRASRYHTANASAADFFVVPFMAKCYFNHVAHYNLAAMGGALDALLGELRTHAQWRTHQHRHLFFFMSGSGASVLPDGLRQLGPAIVVSAEGDREARHFRYGHDIVVPGFSTVAQVDGRAPKTLLASMRGSLHTVTRDAGGRPFYLPNVLRRAVEQALQGQSCCAAGDSVAFEAYVEELKASRFCVIPRGSTPWTRRFFDVVFAACVPVILSNPVHFPFESLIDFRLFTVKIPEGDAFRLMERLHSVSPQQVAELQAAVLRWRSAFDYGPNGHAFGLFLTELSLRKAGTQHLANRTKNGPQHFWLPGHGFEDAGALKLGPTWAGGMAFH